MKRIIINLTLLIVIAVFTTDSKAQTKFGDLDFGLGLGYGSVASDYALNTNFQYTFGSIFRLAFDDNFYFSPSENSNSTTPLFKNELNLNTHFIVINRKEFDFYTLAGMNYQYSRSEKKFNMLKLFDAQIGFGFNAFVYENVFVYTEIRKVINESEQVLFLGGVKYRISSFWNIMKPDSE